jgi:hypothetical protein
MEPVIAYKQDAEASELIQVDWVGASTGTGASAVLVYGVLIDKPPADYDAMNVEWASCFLPTKPNGTETFSPEWHEWRRRLHDYSALPRNVEISWSGCNEQQCYYVHCRAYQKIVAWHKVCEFTLDDFNAPGEEANRCLGEFCERFGITPESQPGWYLASLYI